VANQRPLIASPLSMMDNYRTIRMAKRALPPLAAILDVIIIAVALLLYIASHNPSA